MNLLCKHFFDYQSFVNLPHKAVQLHKTPHNQAGVDPTAGWAPKNLQVQGKNMPASGARASRNNIEIKPGIHRHASKLHRHRQWGERHGELREEKIVPHKDKWMVSLNGDFRHLEDDLEEEIAHPTNKIELGVQLLVILTVTPRFDFLTVTIKKIRGLETAKNLFIRVQLYEGAKIVDEREHPLTIEEPEAEEAPLQIDVARPLPNGSTRLFNKHLIHDKHFSRGRPAVSLSPHPVCNHVHRVHWNDEEEPQLERQESNSTIQIQNFFNASVSESFLMRLTPDQFSVTFLVIQVFSISRRSNPMPSPEEGPVIENRIVTGEMEELIGSCAIGSTAFTQGIRHWRHMIERIGTATCGWHRLCGTRTLPPTDL
ncbi:C2 domain-containing protein [Aphelenchoides besseyi]|nr:C2 domain-containing protein [Aphelenchoides besseyi]